MRSERHPRLKNNTHTDQGRFAAWLRKRLRAMSVQFDTEPNLNTGTDGDAYQRQCAMLGYVFGMAEIPADEMAKLLTPPAQRGKLT